MSQEPKIVRATTFMENQESQLIQRRNRYGSLASEKDNLDPQSKDWNELVRNIAEVGMAVER